MDVLYEQGDPKRSKEVSEVEKKCQRHAKTQKMASRRRNLFIMMIRLKFISSGSLLKPMESNMFIGKVEGWLGDKEVKRCVPLLKVRRFSGLDSMHAEWPMHTRPGGVGRAPKPWKKSCARKASGFTQRRAQHSVHVIMGCMVSQSQYFKYERAIMRHLF